MLGSALDELEWRGLVAQVSNAEGFGAHMGAASRTLYCGFDPTADSLHIGNLVPLLALKRMQLLGHRPIVLLGGATGLIGDPSFRQDERSLNSPHVVGGWMDKIREQVQPFLSFEGNNAALVVNNLDWTASLDVISFLRDIGKHFSVNAMIHRDSVRSRLQRDGEGISYTEFSYMLLQGMDFLELAKRYDCLVQIGGSDQWGNIVSGVDLIRRNLQKEAYGLTLPLVTKSDGSKFGKTATGTVWLDPKKTSPYAFYQFWLNTSDEDVVSYLKYFTFLHRTRIEELKATVGERPHERAAQQALAREVTRLVHGESALRKAERITSALFSGRIEELDLSDLQQLALDGMPAAGVGCETGLLSAMVDTGLARSTSDARKLVESGGVSVNGVAVTDSRRKLDFSDAFFDAYYLIRKGKRNWSMVYFEK